MSFPSSFKPIQEKSSDLQGNFPSSFTPINEQKRMPHEKEGIFYKGLGKTLSKDLPKIQQGLGRVSRAAESIAGIPGEIQELLLKTPGFISESFGINPEKSKKATELTEKIIARLPTSQELREKGKVLTKGFLEPKTAGERFADEFIEFTAPFIGGVRNPQKLLRTALAGFGATGVGKEFEKAFDSKGVGKGAQLGSYALFSLFNPGGMKRYISSLYKEARKEIPKGVEISTEHYMNGLHELEKEIRSSLSPSQSQKEILKRIEEIRQKEGMIHPSQLEETKKSINEDLGKLLGESKNSITRKRIASYMKRISGITKDALREYGKENPEYWKKLEAADRAFATKEKSEVVARTLEKVLGKDSLLKLGIPALLHGGVHMIPGGTLLHGATPLYYMGRFLYRYAKSPELRRYYNQLLLGGSKGNPKMVKEAAKKIEKELPKVKVPERLTELET